MKVRTTKPIPISGRRGFPAGRELQAEVAAAPSPDGRRVVWVTGEGGDRVLLFPGEFEVVT